jgi:tagaturonate epimerase
MIHRIPDVSKLTDEQLPGLFDHNDARQLIHITYGYILSAKNEFDEFIYKDKLFHFWKENDMQYALLLEKHIGKHLELLYKGFKG